jgi:putative acetyltransferase
VRVRQADNRDVQAVVRVIRAVFDEFEFTWDEQEYHADLYNLDHHYTSRGWPFFVAEIDGEVVGTVALGVFDPVPGDIGCKTLVNGVVRVGGADCSLERLYVHPRARRQGVGKELLERTLDEARRQGRTLMELWSDKRFEEAHRLYQRLGATIVGDRICHDPDQSPEWGLTIRL